MEYVGIGVLILIGFILLGMLTGRVKLGVEFRRRDDY